LHARPLCPALLALLLWVSRAAVSDAASSTEGPNRKRCPQVEGCNMEAQKSRSGDISQGKTCEYHRAVGFVVRDGQRTRYCQICHGFQRLTDFDGTKRRASLCAPVSDSRLWLT